LDLIDLFDPGLKIVFAKSWFHLKILEHQPVIKHKVYSVFGPFY
jgi:hypothetical protein